MSRLLPFVAVALTSFIACSAGAASPAMAPVPDGTAAALATAPDGFHYDRPLHAPRALRLYGLNGGVEASSSEDDQVHVRAEVRGKHPESVRIVARDEPPGVVMCVLFADEPPDACRFDGVSRSARNDRGQDERVDLFARVPRGVPLGASALNGPIRAVSLTGDVRASTVSGNIEVTTSGLASAPKPSTETSRFASCKGSTPTWRRARSPATFARTSRFASMRFRSGRARSRAEPRSAEGARASRFRR